MNLRRTLFTVHMWIGLVLGLLLAALGLSGSLLVYDDQIADLINPPPRAVTAGQPLPLSMIEDIARETVGHPGQMQIFLPQKPGEAISVRMGGISPMGNMTGMNMEGGAGGGGRHHRNGGEAGPGRGLQLFIDPVSGEVLGTRTALLPPILTFAHQLHGNFLMGRDGRTMVVGWLGVAMLLLGISGLVLWWPRRGQWKYAFTVRGTAQGVRFHRELHAATGIWIFFIFMAVSFSGVVLAWPQVMGANPPGFNPRAVPTVEATGGKRLGATEAIIAASTAIPGLSPRSVTIPARPDLAISVNYLSNGAVGATVFVDPYRGKVLAVRDPSASFMAWMRPVHQGSLGPVWQFLVFLSGLVPSLFIVTGLIMWWKKRKRHVPMSMPIADDLEEEATA
ncbi:MAG TPA: PepSY-associated TM helix domain-containing protein [Rhizomicrobium sp.]|nr:PepSY-associated TM helix domain-containing protein [Rhizomicrobium sp.]